MTSIADGAALTSPDPAPSPGKVARHSGLGFARFIIGRLGAGIATLFVVSALIFAATKILPGDVAQTVLGRNATPERVAELRAQLDLDHPLYAQFFSWLGGIVRGDLGRSAVAVAQNSADPSIWHLISTPLANSFVLATITALLLLPMTLLLGTLAGARAGRSADYVVSYGALVVGSLPEFVLGTFLILIFFNQLNLLPPVALVPAGTSPFDDVSLLVLPVMTLLGVSLALCLRQVRAGVVEALRQDYVTAARLSGLPERRVLFRYALRNSLAPSVQAYAQTIQYLFGGIVVVEVLFSYPGIGNLLVQSVQTRDTTVVAAIALIIAAFFITVNIAADVLVTVLVPKLRTGATRG